MAAHDGDPRTAQELPLLELLAEDFVTYERRVSEPGLWAVVAHRLGERGARAQRKSVRVALRTVRRILSTGVDTVWGIRLAEDMELGRRVRLWHSGCMQLEARSIGNDVHIRHDTTLGGVRVGHDSFVGANSLVLKHVNPSSTVLGVPARVVPS